jgi:hypothetical protein
MVVVNRRTRKRPDAASFHGEGDGIALPPVVELSDEEARAFFDRRARELVGLSGEEFLRRYDRGDYAGIEEDEFGRRVVHLSMLIPFGRPSA